MKKGSKMTPEQCKKISLGRIGKPAWNKGKRTSLTSHKFCGSRERLFLKDPDSSNALWERRVFCTKSCALKGNKRTLGKNLGASNPSWKGGITPSNALIRSSTSMNDWRKSVFERDDYTCKVCNSKGGELQAHHILAFAKFPALRFDLDNGLTLCKQCHRKTDNYAGKTR